VLAAYRAGYRPAYRPGWRPRPSQAQGVTAGQCPALKIWLQLAEGAGGAGTTLADSADPNATGTPLLDNLQIVGSGSTWTPTPGAWSSIKGANTAASTYANQAAADAADVYPLLGTRSFLVELDCNPNDYTTIGWHNATLFAIGRAASNAAADRGFKVAWGTDTQSNFFRVYAYGASGGGTAAWGEGAAVTGRRHLAFLFDRSGAATDTFQFFQNGVLVASPRAVASAPGDMTLNNSTYGRLALAYDTAGAGQMDLVTCAFWNVRVWTFTGAPPATITDIIAAMAANPDQLPTAMVGVS